MRDITGQTLIRQRVRVDANGCWVWQNYTDRYGIIRMGKRTKKAHRVSWVAFKGPIPAGMKVLHRCDNPPCVNPDHLFLGTQADNVADCVRKGRLVVPRCPIHRKARGDSNGMRTHPGCLAGERNGRSKISDEDRREIVARRQAGEQRRRLAAEYGLNESQILRIVTAVESGMV